MTNREHYAVDDIIAPTACSLVILYGITNIRMIEVATDMVIPGHDYHNKKMLEEYYRVEVLTGVEGHRDDFLDIPTPDGVEKLGQAINEFILWPRWDIRLNDPIPSRPFFGVDDEGGFSHAASPSHHTPPSRDAPPSPEPNPPPSFSLHTNSKPLPNPPASTSMNPPSSPSKKDTLSEPKGHVAKGNLQSVPKMVTPLGKDETSSGAMKKWMAGLARKLDTRSSR